MQISTFAWAVSSVGPVAGVLILLLRDYGLVDVDLLHCLLLYFASSALLVRDPLSCLNDDVGRFWKLDFVELGVLALPGEQSKWDRAWRFK